MIYLFSILQKTSFSQGEIEPFRAPSMAIIQAVYIIYLGNWRQFTSNLAVIKGPCLMELSMLSSSPPLKTFLGCGNEGNPLIGHILLL